MEHDPFRPGGIGLDAQDFPPAAEGEIAVVAGEVFPDGEPASPGVEEDRLGVLRELELAHGVIEGSAQVFGVGGAVEVGDFAHRAAVFPNRPAGVEDGPAARSVSFRGVEDGSSKRKRAGGPPPGCCLAVGIEIGTLIRTLAVRVNESPFVWPRLAVWVQ